MKSSNPKRDAEWLALESQFALYLHGDAKVVTPLFQSIQTALLGYFTIRLGNKAEAEDLSQATLLKIHFSRDRYDPEQSLKTWVFTIASRTLIDHWRGNSAEIRNFGRQIVDAPESDFSESELNRIASELLTPDQKTELNHDLNQALESLKPIDRSIVYLYGVEGMSMAEIAEALQTTEAAAKVRAHRAYRELRKLLVCFFLCAWIMEHYGRY